MDYITRFYLPVGNMYVLGITLWLETHKIINKDCRGDDQPFFMEHIIIEDSYTEIEL